MSSKLSNEEILNTITQIIDDKIELSSQELHNKYSNFKKTYPILFEKTIEDTNFDIEMLKKLLNVKENTEKLTEMDQQIEGSRILYQQYIRPKMTEDSIREMINTILVETLPFVKKITTSNGKYRRDFHPKKFLEDLEQEFKDIFEKYRPILLYIYEKKLSNMTDIKYYLDYYYL